MSLPQPGDSSDLTHLKMQSEASNNTTTSHLLCFRQLSQLKLRHYWHRPGFWALLSSHPVSSGRFTCCILSLKDSNTYCDMNRNNPVDSIYVKQGARMIRMLNHARPSEAWTTTGSCFNFFRCRISPSGHRWQCLHSLPFLQPPSFQNLKDASLSRRVFVFWDGDVHQWNWEET